MNFMRPFASNESGFTLIEVMITSSLILVAALAFAEQANYQNKMLVMVDTRLGASDLRSSIAIHLSTAQACAKTLGGRAVGDSVDKIYRSYQDFTQPGDPWLDEVVYQIGPSHATSNHVYLDAAAITGTLTPGNSGELRLALTIGQNRIPGSPIFVERDLLLKATLDMAGKVSNCQATDESVAAKPIMCSDAVSDCAGSASYCTGELFPNVTKDCLCFGTSVSGTSLNGMSCGPGGGTPSPLPSPTPTPSSTPNASACGSLAVCPTGISYLMRDAGDVATFCVPDASNPCVPGGAQCTGGGGESLIRICATSAPTCPTHASGSDTYYDCP